MREVMAGRTAAASLTGRRGCPCLKKCGKTFGARKPRLHNHQHFLTARRVESAELGNGLCGKLVVRVVSRGERVFSGWKFKQLQLQILDNGALDYKKTERHGFVYLLFFPVLENSLATFTLGFFLTGLPFNREFLIYCVSSDMVKIPESRVGTFLNQV